MAAFDDLESLKRKVAKLQKESDRADGMVEQILKQIKEEFGCKTLAEAEAKLADLQTGEIESFKIYNRKRKKFDLKWAKLLREMEDE